MARIWYSPLAQAYKRHPRYSPSHLSVDISPVEVPLRGLHSALRALGHPAAGAHDSETHPPEKPAGASLQLFQSCFLCMQTGHEGTVGSVD